MGEGRTVVYQSLMSGRVPSPRLGHALQRLATGLGRVHRSDTNAYSEDFLRKKKIVEAKERGMPTVEVARTFVVGLSSVKR